MLHCLSCNSCKSISLHYKWVHYDILHPSFSEKKNETKICKQNRRKRGNLAWQQPMKKFNLYSFHLLNKSIKSCYQHIKILT